MYLRGRVSKRSLYGNHGNPSGSATCYYLNINVFNFLKFATLCVSVCLCFSLELALDLEIAITRPFTSKDFLDEIRGLADASGVDAKVWITTTRLFDFL